MRVPTLVTMISPHVEADINEWRNLDDVCRLLANIQETFKDLIGVAVIIIPGSVRQAVASHPGLRTHVERLRSIKISVIWGQDPEPVCCDAEGELIERFLGFEYLLDSMRHLVAMLRAHRLPMMIDHEQRDVVKGECGGESSDYQCRLAFRASGVPLVDPDQFRKSLSKGAEADRRAVGDHFVVAVTEERLRLLIVLSAIVEDVDSRDIRKQSSLQFHEGFLRDIRSESRGTLEEIAFSVFRAGIYPSRQSPNPSKFSIDWHPNSLRRHSGFDVYRVDILGSRRTGLSSSGLRRAIMARTASQIVFVAYTDSHDVSETTIKNRLSEMA